MWPEGIFGFPRDAAIQNDSPLLLLGAGKAKALEGNRHPYDIAMAGDLAARIPDRVERRVEVRARLFLAGSLRPNGAPLPPGRCGLEGVGTAAVVKGVENNLDLIVVVNVFPARQAGADLPRVVEAHKYYVEIFLVVAQVSVGGLRHTFPIVGIALGEAGDLGHLLGDFSLRLHAQEVFQSGRTRKPRDRERGRLYGRGRRRWHGRNLKRGLGELRRGGRGLG